MIAHDAGITPDPWQAELLRARPRRSLLLCSRQSGKSTVTALTALDTAIYQAPALVLLVSPSQRQSAELFRTVMQFHSKLKDAPALNAESVLKAELANGSRILALPGTERTIRGYAAADLVVIDEAARVEDELLAAVRPMLATSNGRLVALTTPAGKRGWFFETWTGGEDCTAPGWRRVTARVSHRNSLTRNCASLVRSGSVRNTAWSSWTPTRLCSQPRSLLPPSHWRLRRYGIDRATRIPSSP
ncbi:MAG: phage terminase large subunit [Alphaproteobacteria bacterium]|nr:phage terminase large subunit [Alphaproteobacteria bacterium]